MNKLKTLITVFIALVMIGFFVWAVLPKDNFGDKISDKLKKEKEKADVVFKDATLSEIYDGVKYWELVSKHSVINRSIGVANLNVVDGLFFDKGRPTIKFLAPSAVWRIKKNEIYLTDPIGYDVKYEKIIKAELEKVKDISRLRSVFHLPASAGKKYEGYWFSAKNLEWKLSTKKLFCSGAISLTKGNFVINSEKLESDTGLEKVLLTGKPSGEILVDNEKVTIVADTFFVDSVLNIISAEQNVTITKSKVKITAARAVYDQKLDTFDLFGDVFLTDGEITAFSKDASYDIKNNKVILMNKAKAIRNGNEVYGEKMSVFLGQNRIIVEGRTKAKIKETEIR